MPVWTAGSSLTGRMATARRMVGRKVATALALVCSMSASEARAVSGWEVYGGDPGGRRYSAEGQIDRSNVARLEVAWRYRTGELGEGSASRGKMAFEATPILLAGRLYLSTPSSLAPTSGKAGRSI